MEDFPAEEQLWVAKHINRKVVATSQKMDRGGRGRGGGGGGGGQGGMGEGKTSAKDVQLRHLRVVNKRSHQVDIKTVKEETKDRAEA
mmetsp:Transcript_6762/g.9565  ORF Transcript_6762/g.9565 Transcript_6762/m.9565 type:complete len:87 (+) Transcript_6762:3-263(+)